MRELTLQKSSHLVTKKNKQNINSDVIRSIMPLKCEKFPNVAETVKFFFLVRQS